MSAFISDGYWIDIGTPQKYLQVHQDILRQRFSPALMVPSSLLEIAEVLCANSVVDPTCRIGEGCQILSSCIGSDSVIGRKAVIENSVIWPGVTIGESARLSGCIVGGHCEIGSNTVLSPGVVLGDRCRVTDYSRL